MKRVYVCISVFWNVSSRNLTARNSKESHTKKYKHFMLKSAESKTIFLVLFP